VNILLKQVIIDLLSYDLSHEINFSNKRINLFIGVIIYMTPPRLYDYLIYGQPLRTYVL